MWRASSPLTGAVTHTDGAIWEDAYPAVTHAVPVLWTNITPWLAIQGLSQHNLYLTPKALYRESSPCIRRRALLRAKLGCPCRTRSPHISGEHSPSQPHPLSSSDGHKGISGARPQLSLHWVC